jgi:hypothetical protein
MSKLCDILQYRTYRKAAKVVEPIGYGTPVQTTEPYLNPGYLYQVPYVEEAADNNTDRMLLGIERKERLREEKQSCLSLTTFGTVLCSVPDPDLEPKPYKCFWIRGISKKVHIQIPRLRVQHLEKIV